ncbi:unnamed protein product [Lymnaea stagnalis]|uniref:Uncharacterized protein n=1 Tax=Lymnaea stagnalis TaxID=6523 RepID=A0AAV2H758_LYMST
MFHAGGHKGVNTRGRASGFSRHYPNFLSHPDWKAPLRCGILFCTFSCILFVIGVILTWLGVHDVFGESVPITGPILLAVGGLMLLLAVRQFYMAHTRKKAQLKAAAGKDPAHTVITAVGEHDDENEFSEGGDLNRNKYPDALDEHECAPLDDSSDKPPMSSGGYYDHNALNSSCGEPLISGGYGWPPVPLQSPYYSMAMMVYKDPTLTYGPFVSAHGHSETCSAGPVVALGTDLSAYGREEQAGAAACGGSPIENVDMAVLETPSTTLHQQQYLASNASSPPPSTDSAAGQECLRIFPSDYLTSYQRSAGATSSANVGISSFPNSTAFMMIRTLEVQETI